MKAIIPVAGIGIRLRPHTHTQPKALVPVAGKPILAHIVDSLLEAGVEDFVFILGYLGNKIETFIKSNYADRPIHIAFVAQEPREGIGHAIWSAREQIAQTSDVLIVLGDTVVNLDMGTLLKSKDTILGIKKVNKPGNFGVAEVNADGFVQKLIEKPRIPKSNLALVGIYKIANSKLLNEATTHIVENDIKTLGEFQLTDALMYMLEKGEKMRTLPVENWYDCGKKESLLEANAILLNKADFPVYDANLSPSAIIIPPVSIGKNCQLQNSIIGPNVAIGDNSIVTSSIVRNTIVGSYSELNSTVLDTSIIGNDTSLRGMSHSLNIGDNTEINFTS